MAKPLKQWADDQLLSALRNNDKNAIHFVYFDYQRFNWMFMQRYKHNYEDSQDIYQESIVAFLGRVQSENFELKCKISTFFASICRNQWRAFLKGKRKFIDVEDINTAQHPYTEPLEESCLPNDDQIEKAVDSLPYKQRKVVEDFYWKKKSLMQIAAEHNYAGADVVKQVKHRAVIKLKEVLVKAA